MKLFSIYDKRAATYNTPFCAPTEIHAMRNFSMEVNRTNNGNMLNFAPEDFALYHIGEFRDSDANIITCTPNLITEAAALVKQETR